MNSAPLVVAGISVSPDHYIDGQRIGSTETFELHCPIDQHLLGYVSEGLAEHVDQAIQAAHRAFPAWAALGAEGRKPYLDRFAEEIGKRTDALCQLESNDAGVLLSRMRHGVVPRAMLNIKWFAEHALGLQDRTLETEQATHLVRHDPAGVVAIITPWNAPLMLSTWKLGPALASGNTLCSQATRVGALDLFAASRCGPRCRPAPRRVQRGARQRRKDWRQAGQRPAPCPDLIHGLRPPPRSGLPGPQVPTWCHAAWSWVARAPSTYWKTLTSTALQPPGRSCTETLARCVWAGTRFLVHEKIAGRYIEALRGYVEKLNIGDPREEATEVGPLIHPRQLERVGAFVDRAVAGGARVLWGGARHPFGAQYYQPTMLTDLRQDDEIVQNEVFGPVAHAADLPL